MHAVPSKQNKSQCRFPSSVGRADCSPTAKKTTGVASVAFAPKLAR